MARYRLSNEAKEDLIRIHHYGVAKFGMAQADKYFDSFLIILTLFLNDHFHLNQSILLRKAVDVAPVGLIVFITK